MAVTWNFPKNPNPPTDGAMRTAVAVCTTGTEANTAPLTDGLDLRGVAALEVAIELVAKAQGTIRIAGLIPGDTLTINGTVLTATGSDSHPTNAQFKCAVDLGPDHGQDYVTAANLAAAINANPTLSAIVSAFVAGDEALVTITALADGVAGNAFTLATSSARAVLSGATLLGGLAAGNAIAAQASLQAYYLNPVTQRWNRNPDMDLPLQAGLLSQTLAVAPVPAPVGRVQFVPNAVGFACNVTVSGFSGRTP